MHTTTTKTFRVNRLRQRIRNSRRQAKAYEEIADAMENLLTGEGDIRDETIYDTLTRAQRNAQELWDDHNQAIAELKALS